MHFLTYALYSEGNLLFHKLELQKNHRCNLFHLHSSVELCRFYHASVFRATRSTTQTPFGLLRGSSVHSYMIVGYHYYLNYTHYSEENLFFHKLELQTYFKWFFNAFITNAMRV